MPTGEGNGRIVIGRLYTETNAEYSEYSDMEVDEMVFFDRFLFGDQIESLGNV